MEIEIRRRQRETDDIWIAQAAAIGGAFIIVCQRIAAAVHGIGQIAIPVEVPPQRHPVGKKPCPILCPKKEVRPALGEHGERHAVGVGRRPFSSAIRPIIDEAGVVGWACAVVQAKASNRRSRFVVLGLHGVEWVNFDC